MADNLGMCTRYHSAISGHLEHFSLCLVYKTGNNKTAAPPGGHKGIPACTFQTYRIMIDLSFSISSLRMAFRFLLRNGVKLGATGGAAYITIDQGIWGNGEQSEAAYERLVNLMPGAPEYLRKLKIGVLTPIDEYVPRDLSHYWNNGVMFTFSGIIRLPCFLGKYANIAGEKIFQLGEGIFK